jgi:hypothetical protein
LFCVDEIAGADASLSERIFSGDALFADKPSIMLFSFIFPDEGAKL